MKRKKRLQSTMTQFGYEHAGVGKRLASLRGAFEELSRMLDRMDPPGQKEKKAEKEN